MFITLFCFYSLIKDVLVSLKVLLLPAREEKISFQISTYAVLATLHRRAENIYA